MSLNLTIDQKFAGLSFVGPINLAVSCAGIGIPEKIIGRKGIHSTVTFEKIVPTNAIIDYLSLDIEGGEMDLLESIDFSKYKIKVISVENNIPNKINFELFFKKKKLFVF